MGSSGSKSSASGGDGDGDGDSGGGQVSSVKLVFPPGAATAPKAPARRTVRLSARRGEGNNSAGGGDLTEVLAMAGTGGTSSSVGGTSTTASTNGTAAAAAAAADAAASPNDDAVDGADCIVTRREELMYECSGEFVMGSTIDSNLQVRDGGHFHYAVSLGHHPKNCEALVRHAWVQSVGLKVHRRHRHFQWLHRRLKHALALSTNEGQFVPLPSFPKKKMRVVSMLTKGTGRVELTEKLIAYWEAVTEREDVRQCPVFRSFFFDEHFRAMMKATTKFGSKLLRRKYTTAQMCATSAGATTLLDDVLPTEQWLVGAVEKSAHRISHAGAWNDTLTRGVGECAVVVTDVLDQESAVRIAGAQQRHTDCKERSTELSASLRVAVECARRQNSEAALLYFPCMNELWETVSQYQHQRHCTLDALFDDALAGVHKAVELSDSYIRTTLDWAQEYEATLMATWYAICAVRDWLGAHFDLQHTRLPTGYGLDIVPVEQRITTNDAPPEAIVDALHRMHELLNLTFDAMIDVHKRYAMQTRTRAVLEDERDRILVEEKSSIDHEYTLLAACVPPIESERGARNAKIVVVEAHLCAIEQRHRECKTERERRAAQRVELERIRAEMANALAARVDRGSERRSILNDAWREARVVDSRIREERACQQEQVSLLYYGESRVEWETKVATANELHQSGVDNHAEDADALVVLARASADLRTQVPLVGVDEEQAVNDQRPGVLFSVHERDLSAEQRKADPVLRTMDEQRRADVSRFLDDAAGACAEERACVDGLRTALETCTADTAAEKALVSGELELSVYAFLVETGTVLVAQEALRQAKLDIIEEHMAMKDAQFDDSVCALGDNVEEHSNHTAAYEVERRAHEERSAQQATWAEALVQLIGECNERIAIESAFVAQQAAVDSLVCFDRSSASEARQSTDATVACIDESLIAYVADIEASTTRTRALWTSVNVSLSSGVQSTRAVLVTNQLTPSNCITPGEQGDGVRDDDPQVVVIRTRRAELRARAEHLLADVDACRSQIDALLSALDTLTNTHMPAEVVFITDSALTESMTTLRCQRGTEAGELAKHEECRQAKLAAIEGAMASAEKVVKALRDELAGEVRGVKEFRAKINDIMSKMYNESKQSNRMSNDIDHCFDALRRNVGYCRSCAEFQMLVFAGKEDLSDLQDKFRRRAKRNVQSKGEMDVDGNVRKSADIVHDEALRTIIQCREAGQAFLANGTLELSTQVDGVESTLQRAFQRVLERLSHCEQSIANSDGIVSSSLNTIDSQLQTLLRESVSRTQAVLTNVRTLSPSVSSLRASLDRKKFGSYDEHRDTQRFMRHADDSCKKWGRACAMASGFRASIVSMIASNAQSHDSVIAFHSRLSKRLLDDEIAERARSIEDDDDDEDEDDEVNPYMDVDESEKKSSSAAAATLTEPSSAVDRWPKVVKVSDVCARAVRSIDAHGVAYELNVLDRRGVHMQRSQKTSNEVVGHLLDEGNLCGELPSLVVEQEDLVAMLMIQ